MKPASPPLDRMLRVRGTVQGVGFRPFVLRLASELGVRGWVRNDAEGVLIRAPGDANPNLKSSPCKWSARPLQPRASPACGVA